MKKKNILKESKDFNRIINNNRPIKYSDFIIYIERTETNDYKFGFSVGKKIGNAVVRNKIRRQLKEIVSKKDYQNNFNCIIIVGRGILKRNFQEMYENLHKIFQSLNSYKEDVNEKK